MYILSLADNSIRNKRNRHKFILGDTQVINHVLQLVSILSSSPLHVHDHELPQHVIDLVQHPFIFRRDLPPFIQLPDQVPS